MKLIIEDDDIVKLINSYLSPQIRVWGFERTNSSFSAYQLCDSRIYEYLIPTHCFLPPHPDSFLGKRLVELADEAGDCDGYEARQKDVGTFWSDTEELHIQPILNSLDPSIRALVLQTLHESESKKVSKTSKLEDGLEAKTEPETTVKIKAKTDREGEKEKVVGHNLLPEGDTYDMNLVRSSTPNLASISPPAASEGPESREEVVGPREATMIRPDEHETEPPKQKQLSPEDSAVKELKAIYIKRKKAYRIHPDRLARIRSSLSRYIGTQNYHNYTIQKKFRDPSSKRIIKTFVVNEKPILMNDTEWLSLKVHGQSFMMHQIRKMVSMVALVVRCGCHEGRIQDSYMEDKIVVPKAPGLGLLLERPVFDSYNEKMAGRNDRNPIGFEKYEKEMEEFKQREIYERIFREEERDNQSVLYNRSGRTGG